MRVFVYGPNYRVDVQFVEDMLDYIHERSAITCVLVGGDEDFTPVAYHFPEVDLAVRACALWAGMRDIFVGKVSAMAPLVRTKYPDLDRVVSLARPDLILTFGDGQRQVRWAAESLEIPLIDAMRYQA